MTGRGALVAALLLAGCATSGTQQSTGVSGGGTLADASAVFNAERRGLSHIGLRDCGTYRLDLFAPARLNAVSQSQGSLYLRVDAYGAGGPIQVSLPGRAARLQRQTGGAWQDVPMAAALAEASVASMAASGGVASTPVAGQLAQLAPLPAGHYRLWSGRFAAQRSGGAACALSPLWQFSVE